MFALASGSLMEAAVANPFRVADSGLIPLEISKKHEIKKGIMQKKPSLEAVQNFDVASLAGEYVMNYTSVVYLEGSGGKSCTIAPIANTDSVAITNFWDNGVVVKAKVDASNGEVTIPNQVISQVPAYGNLDIAVCLRDGTPDRSAPITGKILSDGSLSLDSWWGVFVKSGQLQDLYLAAYNNTTIERANASMSYTADNGSTESFNVVFKQVSKNLISIKNFANYGQTVEIQLSPDRTGTIESQNVREYPRNANFMTYGVSSWTSDGQPQGISSVITLAAATDNRTLNWGNWTAVSQGDEYLYLGALTSGKIQTNTDIEYPPVAPSAFEGEGSEASPYLVKSVEDLVLLSGKVNAGEKYSSKFFLLANDIDMANYRFTPIAKSEGTEFNGVFDGGNHTIANYSISTGEAGYAGLFGIAGKESSIKNLTVVNAKVVSTNNYNGAIVAQSSGSIENCHVKDSYVEGSSVTGALSGSVYNISGSTVAASSIVGKGGYCGGLSGEVNKSIADCNATDIELKANTGSSLYPAGGLVGMLYEATARNCYFAGSIDACTNVTLPMAVGGIAGACTLGSIEQCFSTGTISAYGTDSRVGGIAGSLSGSSLSDCYFTGTIVSPSSVQSGGLVGYVRKHSTGAGSSVKNSYTASSVDAETYNYDPAASFREIIGVADSGSAIENVYFDRQLTNYRSQLYGVSTVDLVKASGIQGFDASIWAFADNQYPMLRFAADTEAAKLSASVIKMPEGSSLGKLAGDADLYPLGNTEYFIYKQGNLAKEGYYSSIADGKLKIKNEFGIDTLVVKNGSVAHLYYVKVAPVPFDGDGSEVNPFQIKTKEDLVKLAEFTNGGKQYFAGTYFKMTNDIDLQYSTDFKGLCTVANDAMCRFSGIFDGGGFAIHNMKLDGFAWSVAPEDDPDGLGTPNTDDAVLYLGFIGRLASDGVLKNLSIASDAKLSFWASSAPLVGYCLGHVDNCRNYADVVGQSNWIGGIAGQLLSSGKISNCYNEGNIASGLQAVGGIAGTSSGLIENSMNAGTVEAKVVSTFSSRLQMAGGIAGQSLGARYVNVVNSGNVAAAGNVGGISGTLERESDKESKYHNDVVNAINYAMVVANSDKTLVGGIGGAAGTKGEIANTYYDYQILPIEANANTGGNGMKGVETSVLTSGDAIPGFDAGLWSFEKGKYPVLSRFKYEAKAATNRSVVITMPAGSSAKNLHGKSTLAELAGGSWSLKSGKDFTIADGLLSAPEPVDAIIADTIVATVGSYSKVIPLRSVYKVALSGDGSQTNPYLISSAADWNNLAGYMTETGMTFKGEYLKVANDFSFAGTPMTVLSSDAVNHFDGIIDGNGKTISGIEYTATADGQSVVGVIGENSEISNLVIEGKILSEFDNTSGFTSGVYGALTNCVNKVDVTSTKGDGTSGFGIIYGTARLTDVVNKAAITGDGENIAGLASESKEGAEFVRCSNEGRIENTGTDSYTAGLVATANPGKFIECSNKGEIAGTDNASNVAGLVAYASAEAGGSDGYIFDKCYNEADITAKTVAAGLVASSAESSSIENPMAFAGCYNIGNITTKGSGFSGTATAGLIALYTAGSSFTDCYNTGKVTSEKTVYAAGIAGAIKWKTVADSVRVVIKRSYNTGDIVANGNQGGGIVASTPDYITVDSCYNVGNISGKFALGGIAANLNSKDAVLSNCWNAGNVTTSMNRAAGIVGWNNKAATITACFNVGDITNTSKGWATGGIAGQAGGIFTNCYNMGTVTGQNEVGGIVGQPWKGFTQLIGCYNAGKIVAPADTCGNLIGSNVANGKIWNDGNKVENCYYVTDFGTYDNDIVGTATTIADFAKLNLGEAWVSGDDYSLPVLASLADNDYAKLNAARIILHAGDTMDGVTQNFFVGSPEGISWTPSPDVVSIEGTNAMFNDVFTGELTMTASIGNLSKEYVLNCQVTEVSGIDSIDAGHGELLSRKFFNAAGVEVPSPKEKQGIVYIVVSRYSDGFVSVVKAIY